MFQNQVYINPAQAIAGDFASSNPMIYKLSGTGLMVADASGVLVGTFAVLNANGTVSSLPTSAPDAFRIGFVHRENNAQIVTYLAEAGYTIQPGQPVSLFGKGDWFVRVDAISGTPARGAAVLWDYSIGEIQIGGEASGNIVDTGYLLVSESAAVGDVVIISNTGA